MAKDNINGVAYNTKTAETDDFFYFNPVPNIKFALIVAD